MGLLKCCVSGCDSTSDSDRLLCFPKDDNLRNLWMSFLVPYSPQLLGLSKDQLLSRRVCHKHFDKHQFAKDGKRLRLAYPCLFTAQEIAHSAPLCTEKYSVLGEHNYNKQEDENNDDTSATIFIAKSCDVSHNEHGYSSLEEKMEISVNLSARFQDPGLDLQLENPRCCKEPDSSTQQAKIGTSTSTAPVYIGSNELASTSYDKTVKFQEISCSVKKPRASLISKLSSKRRRFVKKITNAAVESLGKTASQRLHDAQEFTNPELFANFNKLQKRAKTFLLMQLKQVRKNKMSRRFTLDEKMLALSLMKQSPKGYRLLEKIFALPHKRTLNRLSEKINVGPGINPQIFKYVKSSTKKWDIKKKLCTIVYDEVALTPHLTFNEKKDEILGFVDVAGEKRYKFCDHALVFMLRGVCSSWRQSVAYYFCEGTVAAAELENILNDIVKEVAGTGLIPVGLVSDQGSTFRSAIRNLRNKTIRLRTLEGREDDGTVHIAGHDLSVFYDPPHLLKGIRNNFITKNIVWGQKTASWKDIEFVFNLDSRLGDTRALPHITEHHVNPTKVKKMKVSVAAKVLSARVAAMLRFTNIVESLHIDVQSKTLDTTAEVVEFFDKLFDSVNGHPGGAKKGKMRKAVKPNSSHVSFWKQAIEIISKIKFKDSASKIALETGQPRYLSVPTLDGWITTLKSFIRLSNLLFKTYGVDYYYPRYINQDPLENFFGRIRSLNYRNTNPDANTFMYAFKSLMLSNVLSPHSQFSNCEEDSGDTILKTDFFFLEEDSDKENVNVNQIIYVQNVLSPSSSSQPEDLARKVVIEKIKVQCSAYTAGYVCRKLSKHLNCKYCLETYTSKDVTKIHEFIKFREYKTLKNKNLSYPNETFLRAYRNSSQIIHQILDDNCYKNGIGQILKKHLNTSVGLAWLGCTKHKERAKSFYFKIMIRLQVHNWCNTINKIFKGDISEKYVNKESKAQNMALKKYKSYILRKKCLSK